jgi:hypothetical protein
LHFSKCQNFRLYADRISYTTTYNAHKIYYIESLLTIPRDRLYYYFEEEDSKVSRFTAIGMNRLYHLISQNLMA